MKTFQAKVEYLQDGVLLEFIGIIDEHAQFDVTLKGDDLALIFDLKEVSLINSLGIRSWVNWMKSLKGRPYVFRNCSKPAVDQFSVLEGFLPENAVVESFFVPYTCETCGHGSTVLFRNGVEFEKGTAERTEIIRPPQAVPCGKCGNEMEMDVIEAKFFRFLKYRG